MKKFIFMIFILVSIVAVCQEKRTDDVYFTPKKLTAKSFCIFTNLSVADNYQMCIKKLTELNIFAQTNSETHTIKTDLLSTKKRNYSYYLTIFCMDSLISVSGMFKTGLSIEIYNVKSEDSFIPIENKGMKGSAYQIVFNEMKQFADEFGYPTEAR